ncbi:MAG: hypothetical protein KDD94_03575 [Calditrichaeota bacterium]|nr:hypothetical protein [Calditrichota bacterium]
MSDWTIYPYSKFSARLNMAIDHSLASRFSPDSLPVLRFYGWVPHAITIGFHQNKDAFNPDKIHESGIDFARRPTGGRAIFHGNELTYAIIHPLSLNKTELYRMSHMAFIDAFKELGFDLDYQRKQIDLNAAYKQNDSYSCFANSAQFEVSLQQEKVIGSAQRVYSHSILQHGSIMISDDYLKLANFVQTKYDLMQSATFIDLHSKNKQLDDLIKACKKALRHHFSIDRYIENTYSPDLHNLVEFVE